MSGSAIDDAGTLDDDVLEGVWRGLSSDARGVVKRRMMACDRLILCTELIS